MHVHALLPYLWEPMSSPASRYFFCCWITFVFHIVLILLSMLLACWVIFGHISGPKYPLPIKTIQAANFQVYLHKLRAVSVESLIPEQRQYPRYSKWPIAEALIGKGVILWISETFVKELDTVGWDPEPCRWLGQDWVPKLWR